MMAIPPIGVFLPTLAAATRDRAPPARPRVIAHDVSRLPRSEVQGTRVVLVAIVAKRVLGGGSSPVEAIEARNNEAGREERSSGTDHARRKRREWRSPDRLPIVLGDPFDASSARRVEEVCACA